MNNSERVNEFLRQNNPKLILTHLMENSTTEDRTIKAIAEAVDLSPVAVNNTLEKAYLVELVDKDTLPRKEGTRGRLTTFYSLSDEGLQMMNSLYPQEEDFNVENEEEIPVVDTGEPSVEMDELVEGELA